MGFHTAEFFFLGFDCILPLVVATIWIWSLIDVSKNEPADNKDKLIWFLMVLFLPGLGGIIYYFVRRGERIQTLGH